ncbi:glucose dehydrogenase [FAD, quinone]-like [Schistocerca serialis cubense]|uniref:glucose dehydrogenase [FAD, quinone]-like n=1 Tax=Schistocerca serialis cubense TaxID=2023355 RepID=UPI00214E9835|nr:glucose dehydrogenase [FAD, quinone]-like [Schistocerca serialis cubense]
MRALAVLSLLAAVSPLGPALAQKDVYDFVIVGGGSAGCALASRLSEIPEWSVLLIEAGGEESIFNQVPMLVSYTIPTAWNWGYRTERSPGACLGLRDQRCIWPRGKVLGGTSVINYMLYTRGSRRDYDLWEALGNPGWGYGQVLHYFKKSEDQRNPVLAASPYHSTGGPLTVGEAPYHTPLSRAFLEAAAYLGYPLRDTTSDPNHGFQFIEGTTRAGQRCSSNKAFLSSKVRRRRNLTIWLRTRALKIIMENGRAVGVQVARKSRAPAVREVRARREVILSAGTLNDPQLLMLSGIGPSQHLRELGIPVLANLSVGYNLQDHVGIGGITFMVNETGVGLTEEQLRALPNLAAWITRGQGPLTVLGGAEAVGILNSSHNERGQDWPDLELLFAGGSTNVDEGGLKMAHDLSDEVYDKVYRPIKGQTSWTIFPIGLHPHSRGLVRLRSRNPYDAPLFYPNYFADPRDVRAIVEGAQLAVRFSRTPAMRRYGSRLHDVPIPGCERIPFATDAYWECQLRHYTMLFHHQVGTCKMGPRSDPDAVVDARLRVHGVRGLRVVDAAIAPVLPSCHTNTVAIMIAEKAADMIKQDHGKISLAH